MTDNTTQQPASQELTINDLNAMKAIIDIASSRGAFKPQEMVAVGQTYAKLASFLETVAAQQAAAEKQQAASGSTPPAADATATATALGA